MHRFLLYSLISSALLSPAQAITDQEREVLDRLLAELRTAASLIDHAAHAANPHDRRQVNYPQLREDLQAIQDGIQAVVNAPRREPRALPPIRGDYR